jgi:hypothetical protein
VGSHQGTRKRHEEQNLLIMLGGGRQFQQFFDLTKRTIEWRYADNPSPQIRQLVQDMNSTTPADANSTFGKY